MFLLSKSYLDRYEKKEATQNGRIISNVNDIQVVAEVHSNTTTSQTNVRNSNEKLSSQAENRTSEIHKKTPTTTTRTENDTSHSQNNNSGPANTGIDKEVLNVSERSKRYCHYFVNYGKCNFEERTGKECRYTHQMAPFCKSGLNCNRQKCMFSHPNLQNQKTFLQNQGPMMNPWQILPPLLQAQQGVMLNPWAHLQNQSAQPQHPQQPRQQQQQLN